MRLLKTMHEAIYMKKHAIISIAALLAGCAGGDYNATISAAQNAVPTHPFMASLKQEYLTLSAIEWAKPDYTDGLVYAQRAKMVAENKAVLPDDLSERGLLIEIRQSLTAERKKLLPLLEQTVDRLPNESARAQAMFDCWAEEAEENFQPEDILACRDQYFLAKTALETRLSEVIAEEEAARLAAEEAARKAAEPAPAPEPVYETVETVQIPEIGKVLFEHNSAKLTAEAEQLLAGFAPKIIEFVPTKLVVNGYTDTSGAAEYNLKLSQARADSVKAFLETQGVKADVFETQGFGETKLHVETADSVKEPANRVVEIVLMK